MRCRRRQFRQSHFGHGVVRFAAGSSGAGSPRTIRCDRRARRQFVGRLRCRRSPDRSAGTRTGGGAPGGCTGRALGSVGRCVGRPPAPRSAALIGGRDRRQPRRRATGAPRRTPNTGRWNSAAPARRSPGRTQVGDSGEVTPGPRYKVNDYDCRDYTHTVDIDGQPQTARGTACRQPDGTWKPVT